MDWLLGVAAILAVGVLAWLFSPIQNRLTKVRTRLTRDHGITLRIFTDPDEMAGLTRHELLDTDPAYLVGQTFFFPRDTPPDPPERNEEWWRWARRLGGEDTYASHVLILLQATLDRTVALLPPNVRSRPAGISTGIVCGPWGLGGNGLLVRRFYIDLDEPRPVARYIDEVGNEPPSAIFRISKGDTEAVLAIAKSRRGRHEWTLELPLVVDGQQFTLIADNNGRPFVTVGPEDVPYFYWNDKRWVERQER